MSTQKIRIGSTNPNKMINIDYIPISTDGHNVLFDNKIIEVRKFIIDTDIKKFKKLIVLTIKERDLMLEALVDFNLDINVFEVKYPIFNDVKYISNIYKNYKKLNQLLVKVKKLNIKGKSLAHQLSTEYLYKIERKLRFKNTLDSFFAFAYKGGYQEVFKLKEERKDRVIIAMDFNSMYIDCMMDDFLEPKSIKYKDYRKLNIDINTLDNGLYRVILKDIKDTFFREFHPFKYQNKNHSYYFRIDDNQDIELMLFKNEIEYYKKFFNSIEILEGFYSKNTIKHPLEKYALQTYKDRLKYKKNKDTLMDNYSKYKLLTIHSATNAKRFKTLYFKSLDLILEYISKKYMFKFSNDLSSIENLQLIEDKNYFTFWKHKNGFKIKVINFDCNESIYSISSKIIANSRMKMVQTIERFLLHNSVEICYTNIDSIHISINKNEVDNFLTEHKDIISNKFGHLKIESISDKGYWFDVGRYWLVNNNKISLFKNIFFNIKNTREKFKKNRKFKIIIKNNIFNYVKSPWINIYDKFTYHKKIKSIDIDIMNFKRYNYNEIKNLIVANDTYYDEILKSKKIKIDLFNNIATV